MFGKNKLEYLLQGFKRNMYCHGLHIFILMKFTCWNPQCDGIWTCGLWKVIRSQRQSPQVSLQEDTWNACCSFCSLPCKDLMRRWPSPRTKSASTLVLDFSASRTARNKCLLFKSPSQWHCNLLQQSKVTQKTWAWSVRLIRNGKKKTTTLHSVKL